MSKNHLLPLYTNPTTDSPLDLTVKRCEMDPGDSNNYLQKSFTATIATLNNPMAEYSTYQQSSSNGYYEAGEEYTEMFDTDTPMFPSSQDPASQSQNLTIPTSYSSPSSPVHDIKPFQNNSPESSVLPKKRKNLWRPYDRSALNASFDEKEGDSGSDSSSNSSSDQEFKTPHTPVDPMKRRKRNMLKYAEDHLDNHQNGININQSNITSSQMKSTNAEGCGDISTPSSSDINQTFTPSSGVPGGLEMKEQVISGMKKRDIFGWSLKLSNSSEKLDMAVNDGPSVCQDGDKTYFELQTVKKNDSHGEPMVVSDTETPVRKGNSIRSPLKQQNSKQEGHGNRRGHASKKQVKEVEKENCKNIQSNRVYIQRKDNVVECVDETQSISHKKDTEKKLSLIDLIEEIEANAIKQDKEEAERTEKRNMGIVKLLEQCNHVKLQALDYLMSNVLIQENGQVFKRKNETVQKMLNGDTIGKVSMLDVVELQVEMGLN